MACDMTSTWPYDPSSLPSDEVLDEGLDGTKVVKMDVLEIFPTSDRPLGLDVHIHCPNVHVHL
jgi:hypothetical protein